MRGIHFHLILFNGLLFTGCNATKRVTYDAPQVEETEEEEKQEHEEEKEEEWGEAEECSNSADPNYRTVVRNGETREFILHIPSSYDSATPTPLVINFHGFGDCASNYAEVTGNFYQFDTLADSENFIVAYPQGVIREKEGGEWDPGDNGSEYLNENDVYFTREMVAEISSEFNIDNNKVYATGYSNGGMMVYGVVCHAGDLIAAGGVMSGIMLGEICDSDEYTSIIHFHGIADEDIPYDGNGHFQSVADTVSIWLNHNNIPANSLVSRQMNGGNVRHDRYSGGTENTSFELYTVHSEHDKEGGHVWFSDNIDGTSPNQILWAFLSNHRLDD